MNTIQPEIYDLDKNVFYALKCCQCEVTRSSESSTFELAMEAYQWNWAVDNNGDTYCGDCREIKTC